MKAFEFIKDAGIVKAREVVAASANALVQCKDGSKFHVNELKHLVESIDIIMDLEGLKQSKSALKDLNELGWDSFEHRWIDGWSCTKERLKQAIADYELIYGREFKVGDKITTLACRDILTITAIGSGHFLKAKGFNCHGMTDGECSVLDFQVKHASTEEIAAGHRIDKVSEVNS